MPETHAVCHAVSAGSPLSRALLVDPSAGQVRRGRGPDLGLWVPYLAALTIVALIAFFLVAISAHIRAHDFGRYLFINATGMLLLCVATAIYCF